jgi:hypothetical protein
MPVRGNLVETARLVGAWPPGNLTLAGLPMIRGVLIAFLLFIAPQTVAAQLPFRGQLLERSSRRPMECWRVFLLDSAGTERDSAVTGRDGTFAFALPEGALRRLRVNQPGVLDFIADLGRTDARMQSHRTYRVPLLADSGRLLPRQAASQRAGTVYYTFVVDTLGRVDVSSAFLIGASTPALARRVERGLAAMQFEPWTPTPSQPCRRVVQSFVFNRAP